MAENPKFNNSDMFKDVTTNTGHTDIDVDNKSEVLATQGNVINSIKTFWNKLRKKLVYAITRENINNAYGDTYHPVYVNSSGIVQVCNPTTLPGSVTNNNINLNQINSLYSGQIVCITVTNNTTNTTSFLTINNKNVYYPTGVQVKVSDVSNDTYLFTFISGNGDKWILNNKINVVMTSNKTSAEATTNTPGSPGLMTADDKAKLNTIKWGANNYVLPIASSNEHGGVKSSSNNDTDSNNKIYHVSVNDNGIMTVNVPWTDNDSHYTAQLKVGGKDSKENQNTTNGNTYLQIVEDDIVTSQRLIKGSGSVTVASDINGDITISGTNTTYIGLLTNNSNNNNDEFSSYTVYGPGGDKANTNYYLAGNGTWVNGKLVPIGNSNTIGKVLKWGANGPYWDSLPS